MFNVKCIEFSELPNMSCKYICEWLKNWKWLNMNMNAVGRILKYESYNMKGRFSDIL